MSVRLGNNPGPSDEYNDPFCELCQKVKGSFIKPFVYCEDCYQYLCVECHAFHNNLHGTKGHVVVTGDDMPKSMAGKPPRYGVCSEHPRQPKDQICFEHKRLVCSKCASSKHKTCIISSVDQACQTVSTSEVDVLYGDINSFKTNLDSVRPSLDQNKNKLKDENATMMKEADAIYKKIIAKADKMYRDMKTQISSAYQSQELLLSRYQKDIASIKLKVESSLDELQELKGKTVDTKIFLKMHEIATDMNQCKSEVQDLCQSCNLVSMEFVPSQQLQEFLSSSESLGSVSTIQSKHKINLAVPEISFLMSSSQQATGGTKSGGTSRVPRSVVSVSEIKARKQGSYNIKTKDDIGCWITRIAITSDGRRLLVDYNNRKVKLFSRDMKLLSSLSMEDGPGDITVVSDQQAVVNMGNKLVILDITGTDMRITRTRQELSFGVDGITKYKDKLIITSPSPSAASVKLIDQSGKVYWSVSCDQQGRELFQYPEYVSSYNDGRTSSVIVSDWGNYTVMIVDGDTGRILNTRQMTGEPYGVTYDDQGNVFVCCCEASTVSVLSRDLSEEKTLLTQHDGLVGSPLAIVYDVITRQLLVSYYGGRCDTVDCFQIS